MATYLRLTMAQALTRWMAAQRVEVDGVVVPYFAGVWAIFGHGNVAGMGEALAAMGDTLPTYRAHNEQGMAHAAIAFAKASRRQRAMACTSSIGPGATNMVTAGALAHVNRLPVLFLPGDVYASRRPDPVLQQIEDFADATVSANDCFRPVSRLFDRIVRPEQLLDALPRAMAVLTDPAACGPVTLALCQDVQAEAFDYPATFFAERVWRQRRIGADPVELDVLVSALRSAERPLIVAGGGVLYSRAEEALAAFAQVTGIPVAETQAGKGALAWDHPQALGSVGVTGTSAANDAAAEADLVIGIGTRLQDFTTGSRTLFAGRRLFQVNVAPHDTVKHGAEGVVADARRTIEDVQAALGDWRVPDAWQHANASAVARWNDAWDAATAPSDAPLPADAHVVGAVWRHAADDAVVVCAAGGLPGELHKLWRTRVAGGYHVEYGFSCMGYEIAGGLGVKMALPTRDVFVMVGDGSYLMLNSELATSVMLGLKITVILLDNRGYGCINRLQQATGGRPFNNLLADTRHAVLPEIDFAAHARSLGAGAEKVSGIAELEAALVRAAASPKSYVVVIDTDPAITTDKGGHWWDVAVPEVSPRAEVNAARAAYEQKTGERMTIRWGVSPIAWCNDDMTELGADTTLDMLLTDVKEIGFAGVELGNKFPRDPETLAPIMAGYGLDVVGGWYSASLLTRDADAEMEALSRHLALLEYMDSSVFILAETSNAVHCDRWGSRLDMHPVLPAADWKQFGERLNAVAARINDRGLRFAYHHHLGTVVETDDELNRFFDATGDHVGLVLDTGHAIPGGIDPVRIIQERPERVAHVHCKDVRQAKYDEFRANGTSFLNGVVGGMFTTPGDGDYDYAPFMQALKGMDYSGWIVIEAEQDPAVANPRDYSQQGLEELKRLAKSVGLA